MSVPERYWGVWKRTLIERSDGSSDAATQVFWLQTSNLFADLRIPAGTAPDGPTSLASCTREQLIDLSKQEGFAGHTTVQEPTTGQQERVQWHREIDCQITFGPDIGWMAWSAPDKVRETDTHEPPQYTEDWERLPGSTGSTWGFRMSPAGAPGGTPARQGILVSAGDYFLFAAERQVAPAVAGDARGLTERVREGAIGDEELRRLLEFELSFGRVQGGEVPWEIELSSLPGQKGTMLFPGLVDEGYLLRAAEAGTASEFGMFPPPGGWVLSIERL